MSDQLNDKFWAVWVGLTALAKFLSKPNNAKDIQKLTDMIQKSKDGQDSIMALLDKIVKNFGKEYCEQCPLLKKGELIK